jgi:hypothetical protein
MRSLVALSLVGTAAAYGLADPQLASGVAPQSLDGEGWVATGASSGVSVGAIVPGGWFGNVWDDPGHRGTRRAVPGRPVGLVLF